MARNGTFAVRLLAPSGKEQPVFLEVHHDGVSFQQESGKASRTQRRQHARATQLCCDAPPRRLTAACRPSAAAGHPAHPLRLDHQVGSQ